jgi:hypothetical protein
MLLLYYYVPESHLRKVNMALFNIGLGKFDGYDHCCWYTKGEGQFRPLAGSNPFLGKQDEIEKLSEYKVEIICPDNLKEQAKRVLIENHPYETPAYGFLPILI